MRPRWVRFAVLSLGAHVALFAMLAAIHPRLAPAARAPITEIALVRSAPRTALATKIEEAPPVAVAGVERRRPVERATESERARSERSSAHPIGTTAKSEPASPASDSSKASAKRSEPAAQGAIDLFSPRALEQIAGGASRFGGTTRRLGDGLPPPGTRDLAADREEAAARVGEMVDGLVGHERVESGAVRPRWREVERSLTERFRPPLALVKQENVGKMLMHQFLRELHDGPPPQGTVPRADDASRLNPLGMPDNFNVPKLAMEQQAASQSALGLPAKWLRTEVVAVIDRAGRILSLRVAVPSGRRRYDRAVLEAVRQAIYDRGPLDEPGPVVTRWAVEAAVAVTPPTALGFAFDESGHLAPGATGIRKYLGGVYPLQQTVKTRVKLLAEYPQR